MPDREKVIKKLAVRIESDSEEWNTIELPIEEAKEILALLKEQETVEHACEILRSNGWTETEPLCSECDAIHVVLCKNCKHWERITEIKNFGYCYLSSKVRSEEWFCAGGERE